MMKVRGTLLTVALLPLLASAQYTAEISMDFLQREKPVSPTLYGIFMEEISHAFDGGLYAELIRNRSFEEGVLPAGMKLVKQPDGRLKMELETLPAGVPESKWPMPWPWGNNCTWDTNRALLGWSLEKKNGAEGSMTLTERHPMNKGSSRSLAMEIQAKQGGLALVNSGYWGIALKERTSYALTFYVRPEGFAGTLTAQLLNERGDVLASHPFVVKKGPEWIRLTATLTSAGSCPKGRFALLFQGEGNLQLDWVSLFPPTWRNKPNGLRPELAQLLADLKPTFVRYPGGCYVEGLSWQSAPDWRKQVMPVEERPGEWGYWQYRSTDGFGYHEFLQFCEDIGADAMYVAFCGMTVHPDNNMPLDQLDPVIQQALDSIEYALGDATTKWGSVRAKMGHPKPFPLKYIEIGNEHPPAIYGKYYVKFREAIKKKYPQVTVIMSMFWSGLNHGAIAEAGDANIDMVDEHAYRNADWIRENFSYFDAYKRKGWDVYVGEYASHNAGGNLYCALGDALYLMMCERNGDLVKMASYAPLFVNVNKKDWGINLIEFDASRHFAHASYSVQKLFREHQPTVNLKTAWDVLPKPDPNRALLAGKIGFGSWSTQVEFKDFKILDAAGKDVYTDPFTSLDRFDAPLHGKWAAEKGVLRQSDPNGTAMLLLKDYEFKTGTIQFKARRVGGSEGFLFYLNASDLNSFVFLNAGAAGNHFTAIQDRGERPFGTFRGGKTTEGKIEDQKWYTVTVKVGLKNAEMYFDDKLVAEAGINNLDNLSVFAHGAYNEKTKEIILKAVNYHGTPVSTKVHVRNLAGVKEAKHYVVKASHPSEENTLDAPTKIGIETLPLQVRAPEFSVALPPYSVNLLTLRIQESP